MTDNHRFFIKKKFSCFTEIALVVGLIFYPHPVHVLNCHDFYTCQSLCYVHGVDIKAVCAVYFIRHHIYGHHLLHGGLL